MCTHVQYSPRAKIKSPSLHNCCLSQQRVCVLVDVSFVPVTDGWLLLQNLIVLFIVYIHPQLILLVRIVGRFGESWLAYLFAAQTFAETWSSVGKLVFFLLLWSILNEILKFYSCFFTWGFRNTFVYDPLPPVIAHKW